MRRTRRARTTSPAWHVNGSLSLWGKYAANGFLPPDQRRPLERPQLAGGVLKDAQFLLMERTDELEVLFRRG